MGNTAYVHWNTNTLKAQYDAGNTKAIISEAVCARCTAPPLSYTATFADIVDADCCEIDPSYHTADVAQYVNGAHTLEYINACNWGVSYSGNLGDYGNIGVYVEADCSDEPAVQQFDELNILWHISSLIEASLYVYVKGDGWWNVFYWIGAIPSGTCTPSGSVNNDYAACDLGTVYYYACGAGSATVVAN